MTYDITQLDPTKVGQGKIIQVDKVGTGITGSPIYEVQNGQLVQTGAFNPNIPNQNFSYQFNPEMGLRPTAGGSFVTADFFSAYTPEAKADETLKQATDNFGMGTIDTFRPRGANETLYDYLKAKQEAGNAGIQLGLSPEEAQKQTQVQIAGGGTTQPVSNEILRAEYKGSAGIDPDVFVGTKAEIEAQARAKGINPANLYGKGFLSETGGATGATTATPTGQTATLTSPDGSQKTVVQVGSQTASDLMSRGWGLGATGKTTVDNTIALNQLQNQTSAINLPQAGQAGNLAQTGEQTTKSIQDFIKEITPPETATSKESSQLIDEVKSLIGQTAGQAGVLQSELEKRGMETLQASLVDIQNQIETKTAAYNQLYADVEGKAISMDSIIGTQATARARAQADIGFLEAQANALMNRINLAQSQAEAAVNAKYTPILESLKIKQAQLELITPELEKEEKQYADALNLYYAQQKQLAQNAKDQEAAIQNVMLQAIQSGITDTKVLTQIQNANSVSNAIAIMGQNVKQESEKSSFGIIGTDENGDNIYGFIDNINQKITPVSPKTSESQAFFTDANGTNWNIAGWAANDVSKQSSMQRISNLIGKLTDDNLESKVKQFTPGLTADMIRETSEKTGVSWEALLTMVTQEATVGGQMSNVANNNNNFGGLTFNNQEWIKQFGGTIGTARPADEGGNYIKFPDKQSGLDAMGALMASYGIVEDTTNEPTTREINLQAFAQQYASTGIVPTGIPKNSFGEIAKMAKEMPKQEGTVIDVNTGVKPDIGDAKIDGFAALYDISKKISDLKDLSNEMITGLAGGLAGKITGSKDQQRYLDLRTEIIDLLARARTGAALTTQEERFYSDQLPGRFSETFFLGADRDTKLNNFEKKINQTLDTKLKANSAAIVGFSTVNLSGTDYKVGDVIEVNGIRGRILADGSIVIIE